MNLRITAGVLALFLAACDADEPARAEVDGKSYAVAPVDGLRVSEDVLQHFGTVGNTNVRGFFLNDEVLTIDDVDPETLLLVRAVPDLGDPEDPWGPFIGLWGGGRDTDLCSYAEAGAVSFCP